MATKQKPRASKVTTSWMKKQSKVKQSESRKKAWKVQMGKPKKEYSPMEAYLREHEGEKPDPALTVELMEEFQENHKCTKFTVIAQLKSGSSGFSLSWLGCTDCGNVIQRKRYG